MDNLAIILLPIKVIVLIFKAISLVLKHTNKTKKNENAVEPKTVAVHAPLSKPENAEPVRPQKIRPDTLKEDTGPPLKTEPLRDFDDLQRAMTKPPADLVVSKAEFDDIVWGFGYDAASTVGFSMRKLNTIQSFMEETQGTVGIHETSGFRHFTSVEDFITWRNNYWGSYYDL